MAIKETIPFTFDDIYAYIEQKYTDAGYDVQEGSNTMQLVTAMSYLTSMLNANTAVNINETLLTLARKRKNILKDARILGYEVAHRQSYRYTLVLEFTNDTSSAVVKSIPKYTKFAAGSYTYYYLGDPVSDGVDSITVPANSSVQVSIVVVEGTLKTFGDYPDSLVVTIEQQYNTELGAYESQNYVDIPFSNVEDTYGVEVFLTYYDDNSELHEEETWTRTDQFMIDSDTSLSKEFVRLDDPDYGTPRIYFKLGNVGKNLSVGSVVQMNVLISSGTSGTMTTTPTSSLDASVISYTIAVTGADEESIDEIRKNAPLFHNSANRAVTKPDYVAFVNRQPTIKYSDVWDGNREWPHIQGYIWFSFVPSAMVRNITTTDSYTWDCQGIYLTDFSNYFVSGDGDARTGDIGAVFDLLDNYKIPTMRFIHRHPVYMDFEYKVKIARYAVKTSKTDINTSVFDVVNTYFNSGDVSVSLDAAETFGYEYFQSNLVKRIDRALTDSMGFDLTLSTSVSFFEKHILNENLDEAGELCVRFHLGEPYEGIFNTDKTVIPENLASLDTTDILISETLGTRSLYLDLSSFVTYANNPTDNPIWDQVNQITEIPIKLTEWSGLGLDTVEVPVTDDVVGVYRIFNNLYRDIEVELFVTSGTTSNGSYTSSHTVGFSPEYFVVDGTSGGLRVEVTYPSPNIPLSRNTIPRLKQVKFV